MVAGFIPAHPPLGVILPLCCAVPVHNGNRIVLGLVLTTPKAWFAGPTASLSHKGRPNTRPNLRIRAQAPAPICVV